MCPWCKGQACELVTLSERVQIPLDTPTKGIMPFDGKTYNPALDKERLSTQLNRVYELLSDGEYWSLEELSDVSFNTYKTVDSEAAISARIRDLRKAKFGEHKIESKRIRDGLWKYRLIKGK